MKDWMIPWFLVVFLVVVVFFLMLIFSWLHLKRLGAGRIPCPACKEGIQQNALVCPFCRVNLVQGSAADFFKLTVASVAKSYWRQWLVVNICGWPTLTAFAFLMAMAWYYNRP